MSSTAAEKVESILPRTDGGQLARLIDRAEAAICDHEAAYTRLVTATEALGRLRGQRARRKAEAVVRLRSQGYTETNAKDFAQIDPEYWAYKGDVNAAEVEREEAAHATENARLQAELARELVRQFGGAR